MVVLPRGSYLMGATGGDTEQQPAHKVAIAYDLAVGKYEVTFAQWDACVADGGCGSKPNDYGWGRGNQPAIDISFDDVTSQYLPWLAEKTGKFYQLLSEAEWEYAARAGTQTDFSWGASVGRNYANCKVCGSKWGGKRGMPVGSFKPNAFGLYDMHGNVWEWVEDGFHNSYAGAPNDGSAWKNSSTTDRVLRGGAWDNDPEAIQVTSRDSGGPDARGSAIGFRVARTF